MRKSVVWVLGVISAIAIAASLYWIFVVLPIVPKEQTGFSQKIFYYHLPAAIMSFVAFMVTFVASIMFLIKKDFKWDILAYSSAEIGLVFGVVLMVFGVTWDKLAWGVWWTWDPRLVTYLILLFLFGAYFFLRSMVTDRLRQARFAAVFGIIAGLDVPVSFFSTRLIKNVLHPVIFSSKSFGLDMNMTIGLLLAFAGMIPLYVLLLMLKLKIENTLEDMHTIKDMIESRRD